MSRRGYSLPFVIMILLLLSVALASLLFVLNTSARSTESMLGRRRLFYACDGIARIASTSAQNYFGQTQSPDATELRDFVCAQGGGCTGPTILTGFSSQNPAVSITDFEVPAIGTRIVAPLDSGPFQGMIAMQDVVEMRVAGNRPGTGWRCDVRQEVSLAKVGLFQFAVFSGVPMDLFSPPPMDIRGPVHINGDFCAGGGTLTIEKLTVSGQLRSGCSGTSVTNGVTSYTGSGGSMSLVPSGSPTLSTNGFNIRDQTGTPRSINSTNDGGSAGWVTNAITRWNGNALDESHDVPTLRLPVATEAPVQPGNNQNGDALTNFGTLRLVIDPPQAGDTTSTAAERFYNKADIRIINGVWYRRDGTILWSDHTGTVDPLLEQASLGVSSDIPMPGPAQPARYSYYERNANGTVTNDPTQPSVVSYGTLFRNNATTWQPGFVNVATIAAANDDRQRIEGTRSGFLDRRVGLAAGNEAAARILPLNFDVAAFIEALQDEDPGELGAMFPGGSFNGIIWIGNSWPNHDAGFTTNATSSTFAGTPVQPGLVGNRNGLPPLPLCGAGPGALSAASGGLAVVNQVACTAANLPRINAVRVYNASSIAPAILPDGLSIVTNGPMYVLGDVNTSSLVAGSPDPVPGTPRIIDASGPWVPMLLAGDAVTLLSTNWQDQIGDRAFGSATPLPQITTCSTNAASAAFTAGPTTVISAILAGHVETGSTIGGGINNFPRFLECWSGVRSRIIGSMVIGFRSVYQRSRFHGFSYRPPNRDWSFDTNFANPTFQPPGTPLFDVQATRRWRR
jgi:hypothetical protein